MPAAGVAGAPWMIAGAGAAFPHGGVVHCGHVAARHLAHVVPHLVHGQQCASAHVRDGRVNAVAWGQGRTSVSGPINGLGEDREGLLRFGLHDNVVGFRHGEAELVHGDRLDIATVGGDDRHLQSRNPMKRSFTRCLVSRRRLAVDQERIVSDVRDVRRVHAHPAPRPAVPERRPEAELARIPEEVGHRAFGPVVETRIRLEIADDLFRILLRGVRQKHRVLAVRPNGRSGRGLDA
jgi:hypothetical protein